MKVTKTLVVGSTYALLTCATVFPERIVTVPAELVPAEFVAATNWSAIRVPNWVRPFLINTPTELSAETRLVVESVKGESLAAATAPLSSAATRASSEVMRIFCALIAAASAATPERL